jgi:DNA-binding response OmpR family regulator
MPNKVLVVDDEISYGEAIVDILANLDLPTDFVSNAKDAFEAIRRFNPSLILLDIMMPETDGLTFLRMLRSVNGSDIPVVVVSAKCSEEDRVTAFRAGANGFLAKPFGVQDLYDVIGPFLNGNSSSRQFHWATSMDSACLQ